MRKIRNAKRERNGERGISLFLVAGGMVFLLGVSALAIDVASLYVARDEAQRAADAGALAGANAFVDTGCLSGGAGACAAFQPLATTRAASAAGQNTVGTLLVSSLPAACVSVTFPTSPTGDPLVSVRVQRTTACGNAMPTFFAKVLGFLSGDVAATATAEAYNPSSSSTGPTICASCLKPLLVPNCDPDHIVASGPNANLNCPVVPGVSYMSNFVDPTNRSIVNSGVAPAGVVGEEWTLHTNPGPSQYFVVDTGCGLGNQVPCIQGCTTALYTCGSILKTVLGAKAGQFDKAIDTLIHATRPGPLHGQDTISLAGTPLAPAIVGGTNNPNPALRLQPITPSDSNSTVTVALYSGVDTNGLPVTPGLDQVKIVGYLSMFIEYEARVTVPPSAGDIQIKAMILSVSGCGTSTGTCGTSGGSGTISGGNGSLLPIRLVRTPGT